MSKKEPGPKKNIPTNRMTEKEIQEFLAKQGANGRFRRREELEWIDELAPKRDQIRDLVEETLASMEERRNSPNSKNSKVDKNPPALAELLSYATTKAKLRESVLGSRRECFEHDVDRFGRRRASWMYWIDTVKSCWPYAKGIWHFVIAGDLIQRWWRS